MGSDFISSWSLLFTLRSLLHGHVSVMKLNLYLTGHYIFEAFRIAGRFLAYLKRRACLTMPSLSGITIYRNKLRHFRTMIILAQVISVFLLLRNVFSCTTDNPWLVRCKEMSSFTRWCKTTLTLWKTTLVYYVWVFFWRYMYDITYFSVILILTHIEVQMQLSKKEYAGKRMNNGGWVRVENTINRDDCSEFFNPQLTIITDSYILNSCNGLILIILLHFI